LRSKSRDRQEEAEEEEGTRILTINKSRLMGGIVP
jgi:hypothetical protein